MERDYNEGLSSLQIKQKYNINCSDSHCVNFLKSLGIKRRTLSESLQNYILNGGGTKSINNNFKTGYHTTWDGRKVFYRSSYELDYCMKLDSLKEYYEMETIRIPYYDSQQNRTRISIPDFYLPKFNRIVEIKSDYTYDEINMKDKVKAYTKLGYDFKLIKDKVEYNIEKE